MSRNLFDFATKELSQDAFLRWILENYDDPAVGKASLKLISSLASLYPDCPLDANKITNVKTYAQLEHMDVVADVFANDKKYTFIIEDKTTSKDHDNQLKKYDNPIQKFDSDYKYKIYYKTDFIEYKEKDNIAAAEWKIFDINKIRDVFIDFTESENTVLSYYSKYIVQKHLMMSEVSKNPMREWSILEYHTYIREVIKPLVEKTFDNIVEVYIWKFRGSYVSFGAYYPEQFNKRNKPLVEFTFRPKEDITAVIHVESIEEKDNWNKEHIVPEFWEKFDKLFNEQNIPSFKRINNKLSIASLKERIVASDVDTTSKNIIDIIEEFVDFFAKFQNIK